ncbi:MAG: hypothetical protein JNM39_16605 [Bdellovibrionaceae bacterium]|nr:hypothetical protein [Pseudobdellovibrionaceae bacterium]
MIKFNPRGTLMIALQFGALLWFTHKSHSAFGAESAGSEEDPYWEYGASAGFIRLEHYPASRFYGILKMTSLDSLIALDQKRLNNNHANP